MLGGIIGLCLLDYRLTLLVLLFLPVKAFMMSFFARKRKEQMDSYIQQAQSYSRWFGSTVGGAKEIKLFGIYQSMMDEFRGRKQKVIQLEKDMTMLSQYNSFADGSVIQFMIALIYILGAVLIMREELTIGTVFAFISYSVYVTAPITAILDVGFFLSGIIPSTKRFFGLITEEAKMSYFKYQTRLPAAR